MAIPDYQTIMKPLLFYLSENSQEQSMETVIEAMYDKFALTEKERSELLPSGMQGLMESRVGWARTYLKEAGLLQSSRRGYIQITELGKTTASKNPPEVNVKFLEQFDSFLEFRKRRKAKIKQDDLTLIKNEDNTPPNEMIETGLEMLNADLADKLYGKICRNTPAFFESIVLDLLSKMGYGQGKVTGRSGDGGIDGFINQDSLGLEKIYFQAKRFTGDTKVTASMVRDFVGSLTLKNVVKGVFITSTDFPKDSEQVVSSRNIVLINKDKLLQLMIKYNVGVSVEKVYEVKRLDSDYFPED
jgi:restriction system protein